MIHQNIFIYGFIAFFLIGCNPEMRELARASCALTEECYAPGVPVGTNPYNKNRLKDRKPTYVFTVRGSCPSMYNRKFLISSSLSVDGTVCSYG